MSQASGRPFALVLADVGSPEADGFALAESIKQDPTLAGATIVMLTSMGQPGDEVRCRELGISACLHKPIKRSELRGAILVALGGLAAVTSRPLVTRHTLRESHVTGGILVIDDNRVSQLLTRRLLEKRGYAVLIANNAGEALALLNQAMAAGISCVLLDGQVPEVDGLGFAALVRERERTTGGHIPIIAMITDGVEADRQRCLGAGMDGAVSKPIRPSDLYAVVERSLGSRRPPG